MKRVTDSRSNANDQIEYAAKTIGRSKQRRAVFEAIYRGKKKAKTVAEIEAATGLGKVRVLQLGRELYAKHIVGQTKIKGETAYTKDDFFGANRDRILRYVDNPSRLAELPTKTRPSVKVASHTVRVEVSQKLTNFHEITIDDINSFSKVRSIASGQQIPFTAMLESDFKEGVKTIIGDHTSSFKDWGGEINDLMSTRVKYKSKRIASAFAFKGRGTKGKLTPSRMGKNGDQIARLFESTAELFVLQFWGEIDEAVRKYVETFALAQSVKTGRRVLYCIIDGVDSTRLIRAYPEAFPDI